MKESIIVFGVLTGILLPVRLVFVNYFSDDWFGSFGLISIISIAIVILAKKQKLGRFGKMFENQMLKIHQGKRRIIVYTSATIIVLYLSISIYSINEGNSTFLEEKNLLLEQFKEMVKLTITPLLTSLSLLNYVNMDSEESVLGYGISLIMLNVAMYVGIPASIIFGIRKRV